MQFIIEMWCLCRFSGHSRIVFNIYAMYNAQIKWISTRISSDITHYYELRTSLFVHLLFNLICFLKPIAVAFIPILMRLIEKVIFLAWVEIQHCKLLTTLEPSQWGLSIIWSKGQSLRWWPDPMSCQRDKRNNYLNVFLVLSPYSLCTFTEL